MCHWSLNKDFPGRKVKENSSVKIEGNTVEHMKEWKSSASWFIRSTGYVKEAARTSGKMHWKEKPLDIFKQESHRKHRSKAVFRKTLMKNIT